MHIKDYLGLACLNQRLSDSEIASRLGLTPRDIAAFRRGRALPGDEITIIIGKMAGAPHELMLRELAQWRARPPRSRRRLSRRLSAAAVPLAGED